MGAMKLFATTLSGLVLSGALAFGLVATPAGAQERSVKVWFGRENFIPDDRFETFRPSTRTSTSTSRSSDSRT